MKYNKGTLKDAGEQLYTFLQSVEGIVWEADTDMRQFNFISKQVQPVLGFSPEYWLNTPGLWAERIHPDDREVASGYRDLEKAPEKSRPFEYRMIHSDGHIVWVRDNVSLMYEANGSLHLLGIMLDTSTAKRLSVLEHMESDVLRLNSDLTIPLQEVLSVYLDGLEGLFPRMHCSIHRISNGRLAGGVSPSLPRAYLAAIDGLPVGENEGSCGAAAALKRQVIVSDTLADPRWEKYRLLATTYHLRACWSNPVIDTEGDVMATLAIYYQDPKAPGEEELKVMERATALLRIVLENRQKTEIISEANMLMLQSQELAHFGNWRWDVQADVVTWSPALYVIYGLDPRDFKATFAGYQELLHPDDLLRVYQTIENVLKTGEDAEFDERIIRPGGEVRHLRSWAKLKADQQGRPVEMIGACLDVTERVKYMAAIEQKNQQLQEIAWAQSHLIRSPLTRIMGIIELIKHTPDDDPEKAELLHHLLSSAHELDDEIRRICEKTEP